MPKFSVTSEISFLQAGLGQLKDYLLSNEIFWNVGGSQQLTLSNLRLFLRHAERSEASIVTNLLHRSQSPGKI